MTEAEWNACRDVGLMLRFLRDKSSDRKRRLLVCGITRQVWHLLTDRRSIEAVDISESYSDNAVDSESLLRGREGAEAASLAIYESFRQSFVAANGKMRKHIKHALPRVLAAQLAALTAAENVNLMQTTDISIDCGGGPEHEVSCMYLCHAALSGLITSHSNIVHDLFGNPFCLIAINASWLSSTVTSLAEAIYDECRFGDLPILADALEDAGCTNADILNHCRQPGEHVRGCWVIDLLLGKK